MQLSFKASFILISTLAVCGTYLYAAPNQDKLVSCLAKGAAVVPSVDGSASHTLGDNYDSGEGVPQDSQLAFQWYCNGAMQHDPDSQLKVALLLLEGKGTPKDISKGMKWLNIAANNGSHDAELSLGILLVDSDPMRSAILFKRAAASGNLYANHRLAELYYYGIGVPQDYAKAQELSELGVAAGFDKSRDLLTRIRVKQVSGEFKTREPVPKAESIAQIQNPPQSQEKEEKSNSIFQSLMAVLPKLSSDEPPHDPAQVEVSTSKAMVLSDEKDITQSKVASIEQGQPLTDSAISFAASTIEPALPIMEETPIQSTNDNQLFDGGVKTVIAQENLATDAQNNESGLQSQTRASELEESLLQSAQREAELEAELKAEPAPLQEREVTKVTEKAESKPINLRENDTANDLSPVKERAMTQEKTPAVGFNALSQPLLRDDLLKGADWINQQPSMRYSIQLVQASQVQGILKYIQEHNLDDNAYYIHALQDGQYRYILLYGDYPNNKTSKAVAKTLPPAVQKAGYWIRTYGDLRRSYVISP